MTVLVLLAKWPTELFLFQLATHQNDTSIFSGFGYSLFSLLNVVQSSPAHKFCLVSQKAIRDAAFHPNDSDLILIVSLDKTAKLIDVRTGTRIHTFHSECLLNYYWKFWFSHHCEPLLRCRVVAKTGSCWLPGRRRQNPRLCFPP